ncbi:MAG: DNA-binding protein [Thermomicrobiales bacterium]
MSKFAHTPASSPSRPLALAGITTAAARYDVSPKTVRRHIAEGRLTGYRIGPRLLKVDITEADAVYLQTIPTATAGRR